MTELTRGEVPQATATVCHTVAELTQTGGWSRHSDLNRGPAVYETAALPLSYVGAGLSIGAPCIQQDVGLSWRPERGVAADFNDQSSKTTTLEHDERRDLWSGPISRRQRHRFVRTSCSEGRVGAHQQRSVAHRCSGGTDGSQDDSPIPVGQDRLTETRISVASPGSTATLSTPVRLSMTSASLAASAWVIRTNAARPLTSTAAPRAFAVTVSSPVVPLTVTASTSPSPDEPPSTAARSTLTRARSVPVRSLTVTVSVPPWGWARSPRRRRDP